MNPPCNWCSAGLSCKDHPNAPRRPPPPLIPPVENTPAPASRLPKSFHMLVPSQPVVLTKPFNECSNDERTRIVMEHLTSISTPSSAASKRKSTEAGSDAPSAPKRPRAPDDKPPLISSAWDVYRCVRGCETKAAPVGANLEQIEAEDAAYQRSQPPQYFRHPAGEYLRCIHCLSEFGRWTTWTNRKDGLTGRIREHLQKHHHNVFIPRVVPSHPRATDGPDYSDLEYSPETFTKCLGQWIASDDQAMNVVESPEFRKLLVLASRAPYLQDRDIPHRTKVTKTIGELYAEELVRIQHDLKYARGDISITSDLWSDPNMRGYMAVTVHYISHEGHLAEHLIAFRRIKGRHTGINLGRVLFSILDDFGITPKLGHITLDNASNNDTLMVEIEGVLRERGIVTFGCTANCIQCFPHVINLVFQTTVDDLPGAASWFRDQVALNRETLDNTIEDYLLALESGLVAAARSSIDAMRKSDLRRDGFTESIKLGNFHGWFRDESGEVIELPVLQLMRDSKTRWGSTYNMLQRYLLLYPAVQRYSLDHPDMKIPILSRYQCEVIEDILSVLAILNSAQELLSAERTPTLSLALPVYENLIQALRARAAELPMLQYAIERGVRKLDAYVAQTRGTPAYALAMVVNPCLKFRWIDEHWDCRERNGARVYLKEAMLKIRQDLHQESKPLPGHKETSAERATRAQANGYMRLLMLGGSDRQRLEAGSTTQHTSSSNSLGLSVQPPSPFPPPPLVESDDNLLRRHMIEVDAELLRWEAFDQYDGATMGTIDLVEFWKAQHYYFPLIYQVAMNILPVQASSVSSERAFSSSKMTSTRERSLISVENMEYLQVLKHSVHRRRGNKPDNHQTLDFMAHVVGADSDDEESGGAETQTVA